MSFDAQKSQTQKALEKNGIEWRTFIFLPLNNLKNLILVEKISNILFSHAAPDKFYVTV